MAIVFLGSTPTPPEKPKPEPDRPPESGFHWLLVLAFFFVAGVAVFATPVRDPNSIRATISEDRLISSPEPSCSIGFDVEETVRGNTIIFSWAFVNADRIDFSCPWGFGTSATQLSGFIPATIPYSLEPDTYQCTGTVNSYSSGALRACSVSISVLE